MPITSIPAGLDFFACYMIWVSSLSMRLKIIMTVIIVLKFVLFFYIALMSDSSVIKNVGTVTLFGFNLVLLFITLKNRIPMVAGIIGITMALLLIWYIGTSCSLSFNKRQERK